MFVEKRGKLEEVSLDESQYCDSNRCQYQGDYDEHQYGNYAYCEGFEPAAVEEMLDQRYPDEQHD